MTKDPNVWGELVPRADALVLGVGGMDHLPAAMPTWLREGIPYVRPGSLRRRVRRAYAAASPHVIRATRGSMRQLPQAATDHYLARIVDGVRTYRPGLPVVLLGPSPYAAPPTPPTAITRPAVAAGRRWAAARDAGFVDLDPIVLPDARGGARQPRRHALGLGVHAAIGRALAAELLARGWPRRAGDRTGGPDAPVARHDPATARRRAGRSRHLRETLRRRTGTGRTRRAGEPRGRAEHGGGATPPTGIRLPGCGDPLGTADPDRPRRHPTSPRCFALGSRAAPSGSSGRAAGARTASRACARSAACPTARVTAREVHSAAPAACPAAGGSRSRASCWPEPLVLLVGHGRCACSRRSSR